MYLFDKALSAFFRLVEIQAIVNLIHILSFVPETVTGIWYIGLVNYLTQLLVMEVTKLSLPILFQIKQMLANI